MEVAHSARNVYLEAVSLGMGTVVVWAFNNDGVERLLQMPDDERAVCIMPVERVQVQHTKNVKRNRYLTL